jgi:hypothetical protein
MQQKCLDSASLHFFAFFALQKKAKRAKLPVFAKKKKCKWSLSTTYGQEQGKKSPWHEVDVSC